MVPKMTISVIVYFASWGAKNRSTDEFVGDEVFMLSRGPYGWTSPHVACSPSLKLDNSQKKIIYTQKNKPKMYSHNQEKSACSIELRYLKFETTIIILLGNTEMKKRNYSKIKETGINGIFFSFCFHFGLTGKNKPSFNWIRKSPISTDSYLIIMIRLGNLWM